MRTNASGVTEKAHIRTDMDKYGDNLERIFLNDKIKELENKVSKYEETLSDDMFRIDELEDRIIDYIEREAELEKKLEIAIEALSLIGGPVEFYCEVGEANKQSAASEALAKIKGEEVGG